MNDTTDTETRRKKLLFRAQRRGFKEVDLVFGAFADAHLANLDAEQLKRFETFLDLPDWDVYDWIVGSAPVPAPYDNDIFALLCAYRENLASKSG